MKKANKSCAAGRRRLGGESGAFLCSSREITVTGCKKILHYSTEKVILLLSDGIMEIVGQGICAATYFGREIRFSGRLSLIKLSESGEKDGCG